MALHMPRASKFLLFSAVLGLHLSGYARCKEGTEWKEQRADGSVCDHVCVSGQWQVECTAPAVIPIPMKVHPKYLITSVIYAPPGRQGGMSSTTVKYDKGSGNGVVVSGSNSFELGAGFSVEVKAGVEGAASATGGLSLDTKRSTEDSSSAEVTMSSTTSIDVGGPAVDGIDHGEDQIWLWLSPTLDGTVTPTNLTWWFDNTTPVVIQYVLVKWLVDPSIMPAGVLKALNGSGITPSEFPTIIAADPFAQASPPIDSTRYLNTNHTLPYEPNDSNTQYGYAVTSEQIQKSGRKSSSEYKVGVSIEIEAQYSAFIKGTMKASDSWTWSSMSATEESKKNTEVATVNIGGPSMQYSGPTIIAVFYDTMYRTFLFVPQATAQGLSGRLIASPNGRSVIAGIRVTLVSQGKTYTTFTDSRGRYRFPDLGSGKGSLSIGGHPANSVLIGRGKSFDLKLH